LAIKASEDARSAVRIAAEYSIVSETPTNVSDKFKYGVDTNL
jgi:hypothetical protein